MFPVAKNAAVASSYFSFFLKLEGSHITSNKFNHFGNKMGLGKTGSEDMACLLSAFPCGINHTPGECGGSQGVLSLLRDPGKESGHSPCFTQMQHASPLGCTGLRWA